LEKKPAAKHTEGPASASGAKSAASLRAVWKWIIPLSVLPVVGLLAYGFRVNPRDVPSPLIDRPAAAFQLQSFDGQPVSLSGQRGRVIVLNFWASWCVPACYDEAPVLERGWRDYRDRGVAVIGIDIQDTAEAARKFMANFGLSFPNAPDPDGRVSIDYGVYGVPETFFIDRDGRIRAKHVGAVTDEVFRTQVDRLLTER
jgi:cytochrome c biogenesis protein CcmG, thiol:disulfide interchange protein DsbE